jgi:lipopolysaccharide/colanic/teichoic acid biosynthesis glycosyltransferase
MKATLLLPAGVTSQASIFYKDEDKLLENADDVDKTYVERILPEKMKYNLKAIKEFSLLSELKIMFMTVLAVVGVDFAQKDKKTTAKHKTCIRRKADV